MIQAAVRRLETTPDAQLYEGCPLSTVFQLEQRLGFELPEEHRRFLVLSDGVEAFGGFFRLFGALRGAPNNLVVWNHEDSWKFAWDGRAADFFCFGETGWGDQYAYYVPSLRMNRQAEVYLLDHMSMTPVRIADSFEHFLAAEFLFQAETPDDAMIVEARRTYGDLKDAEHLIYTPSRRIGTAEKIENVDRMDAQLAMTINGDVAIQCDALPEGARVSAFDVIMDEHNRPRISLQWLPPE